MLEIFSLFWGTVLLRPYVFAFLAVYLAAGAAHMGWKRTLLYIPIGYFLAWSSEFASINWGFPYGDYFYIHDTMGQELWVAGVPFMDSLSYVFLSYCSYSTAIFLLSPVEATGLRLAVLETHGIRRSWETLALGAFLFVLLDIIIDPVSLQGYKWFLGQIYGYRQTGIYFGIPLSNFAGWLVVGLMMVYALQVLDRASFLEPVKAPALAAVPLARLLGPILYVSVLIFNLAVTFRIGDRFLGTTGCIILIPPALLSFLFTRYKARHITVEMRERHFADFPSSEEQPRYAADLSVARELADE